VPLLPTTGYLVRLRLTCLTPRFGRREPAGWDSSGASNLPLARDTAMESGSTDMGADIALLKALLVDKENKLTALKTRTKVRCRSESSSYARKKLTVTHSILACLGLC
jgi:hypothetical protein